MPIVVIDPSFERLRGQAVSEIVVMVRGHWIISGHVIISGGNKAQN